MTSSGVNSGLGIFDTTIGGPNDPSQDPDLLVDTKNVLILQTENYPPDANDVFPMPNDDVDGGVFSFAFAHPAEARSLRLIDIDAGDRDTVVTLTDSSGRQRIYTVPRNWTGDLRLGQPGQRPLALTTLAPQPGFGSIATATEQPNFDPTDVTLIDVEMNGSGALDDLVVLLPDLPHAALRERNGSGRNARTLRSASLPQIGAIFRADLDCSGYGPGVAMLTGRRNASSGTLTLFGEVLVSGEPLTSRCQGYTTAATSFSWTIPHDLSLLGMEVHLQGLCKVAPSPVGKLRRIRGGLSNALDLVVGF